MGIIFNMVKDYTFLFKGGKFMDNFEKVEGEKLGEVAAGRRDVLLVDDYKCIKCGKTYLEDIKSPNRNPFYCHTCRNKGVNPEVSKYKKVIQNPILLETKN